MIAFKNIVWPTEYKSFMKCLWLVLLICFDAIKFDVMGFDDIGFDVIGFDDTGFDAIELYSM